MRITLLVAFCLSSFGALGQSVQTSLDPDYLHLIDRFEIKSGRLSDDFQSGVKPYSRRAVVNLTRAFDRDSAMRLSPVDSWNLNYLRNDSWEWLDSTEVAYARSYRPVAKLLYRRKADFLHFEHQDSDVHINPILYVGAGKDDYHGKDEGLKVRNTRGVEIRGHLNKKLGFYTMVTENQVQVPGYVRSYATFYKGFPQEGFVKVVGEDTARYLADYVTARGYLIFRPIKSLELQFGHDRHYIGSGIRSLVLSDFSVPSLFLKAQVQLGRFNYTSIFSQMQNAQLPRPANGSVPFPPKYMAYHRIGLNVLPTLNIGLHEIVMFGKRQIGFDPNYLNPVIFYKYVEGLLGSSDNSIVGADFKLNLFRRVSTYGQIMLDEFSLSKYKKGGWWAQKYAYQIGAKYIDVAGINNLDIQVEYNQVRPFVYSHFSTYSNFVSYNMPMAHPLGSNFQEWLGQVRVQPHPRVFVSVGGFYAYKGEDYPNGGNYGSNVQRLYDENRVSDYNNRLGQGNYLTLFHLQGVISYMVRHNLFIDLSVNERWQQYRFFERQHSQFAMAAIRWNFSRPSWLF